MNWIEKIILKIAINHIINKEGVKEMISKIRDFLSGKKTYLVMVGLIIEAVVEYTNDGDLGKFINKILIAIGGITLRAGISKK